MAEVEEAKKEEVKREEEDDDEEICRICRCGQEDERPLFHPCICTGSIKFVHEDCLLEWLSHSSTESSRKSQCELCGHRFGFTPVYEPGAPSSLSFLEIASLSAVRALKVVPFVLRLVLVLLTWGIFIPISTCVMFRILSLGKLDRSGSFHEAYENAQSGWASFFLRLRMALEGGYYSSWGVGLCASACIFLSFLTLISIVDFVREHDMLTQHADELYEDGEEIENNFAAIDQDEDGPGAANDEIVAEDQAINPQEVGLDGGNHDGDMNWENGGEGQDGARGAAQGDGALPGGPDELDHEEDAPENEQEEGFFDGMGAFINGDDNDNNPGEMNVALDELLGLRGPGWVLFHNVLWLLTFNGLYLCVALFAPTTVGAVVISAFVRLIQVMTGSRLLSMEDEAFLLRTLNKLRSETQSEESSMAKYLQSRYGPWFVDTNSSIGGLESSSFANVTPQDLTCLIDGQEREGREKFFEELRWVCLEVGAVLVGYITVAWALATLYLGSKFLRDRARDISSRQGWGKIARVLKLMSLTFKVVIVVFLKMGVFPVLLGVLLEYAGRDLVDLGAINRYIFATEHPVFAVMILWVAGITHMLVITVIVLELRDVLHPDILHGIIRPKDADESLLRTVLEDSIFKHMRRMALSCAIYTFLVWAFIYLPKRIVMSTSYSWVIPFEPNLNYTVLELQLPVELICIHIGVLNLLDQGKDQIRQGIELWFSFMCRILGLTAFLLPRRDPNYIPSDQAGQHNGSDEDDEAVSRAGLLPRETPSVWGLRVAFISFFAWVTCLLSTGAALVAPLFVGRYTVTLLQIPFSHEPLIYGVGCLVLWRAFVGAHALHLHRAPVIIFNHLQGLVLEGSVHLPVTRSHVQWMLFITLSLFISPWMMGALIQMNFLLPVAHPRIVQQSSAANPDRWQLPEQLHGLLVALAGQSVPVTLEEVTHMESFSADSIVKAEAITEMLTLSSSPVHDWMVGLVLELILVQLFMLPDLMRQREALSTLHQKFVTAAREMVSNFDCNAMLKQIVLPACGMQLLFLLGPMVLTLAFDLVTFPFGASLVNDHGIFHLYRRSSFTMLLVLVIPNVALEAQKTWLVVHDALRDERYLIGKRLHNMEQTQKRYSQKRGSVF